MRLLALIAMFLCNATLLSAQTIPIDVTFKLMEQGHFDEEPLPGAKVRLVLGESPNWRNGDAGHTFVTDAKGEPVSR